MFGKGERKKILILFLIDWSNLSLERTNFQTKKLSLTAEFDRVQRKIRDDLGGEIVWVFIFAPPRLSLDEATTFWQQGFFVIHCPPIKTKEGEIRDTTDHYLMEFLKRIIEREPDLTHIVLGSGDKDFCQAMRQALRKGLKLIIMAGDLSSLSSDLANLADKNSKGKRMVYLLSPATDN